MLLLSSSTCARKCTSCFVFRAFFSDLPSSWCHHPQYSCLKSCTTERVSLPRVFSYHLAVLSYLRHFGLQSVSASLSVTSTNVLPHGPICECYQSVGLIRPPRGNLRSGKRLKRCHRDRTICQCTTAHHHQKNQQLGPLRQLFLFSQNYFQGEEACTQVTGEHHHHHHSRVQLCP